MTHDVAQIIFHVHVHPTHRHHRSSLVSKRVRHHAAHDAPRGASRGEFLGGLNDEQELHPIAHHLLSSQ